MAPIRKILSALLLTAGAAAVFAAPEITVDNMTFDGGKAAEGSILKTQFKITNTGDEPLKITNVRPGCGCTVVSYDSVIAPGKSGFIKPEVNLKGFHPGEMSRGVTVNSNAANDPTIHLMIKAVVTVPIELSENYLNFEETAKLTLTISSAKKDLKVSSVVFKPQGDQNIPGWAADTPIKVQYTFSSVDSSRSDGLKTYKLNINAPNTGNKTVNAGNKTVVGNFEISTNHPDKKEISIRGQFK